MLPLDLFPVDSVLFPDGILRLKVFEARYIDLITRSLKNNQPFGLCLIKSGAEVGEAAVPYEVGTLAHITDWAMPRQGVFNITVLGGQRYKIHEYEVGKGQLISARVTLLEEQPREKVEGEFGNTVEVLYKLMRNMGSEYFSAPQRPDDVDWVANRLAELLPIDNVDRQSLLELDDARIRLQAIGDVLSDSDFSLN